MNPAPPSAAAGPDLKTLYRRMMNRHFTMAADEYREGASDSSVARHADDFYAAEKEFLAALDLRNAECHQLAGALAKSEASAAALRQALTTYEDFWLTLFASCASNGVFSAWGKSVDCTQMNEAHRLAEPALATDAGRALLDELIDLRRWKAEQLAVESTWDCQAVGKLLGLTLGQAIHQNIEPRIRALLEEVARLREQSVSLRSQLARSVDAMVVKLNEADRLRDSLAMSETLRHAADRIIRESADALAAAQEINKIACADWAEDHTRLQQLCRQAGVPADQVEGDSRGVPGISDLADRLVEKLAAAQRDSARLDWLNKQKRIIVGHWDGDEGGPAQWRNPVAVWGVEVSLANGTCAVPQELGILKICAAIDAAMQAQAGEVKP